MSLLSINQFDVLLLNGQRIAPTEKEVDTAIFAEPVHFGWLTIFDLRKLIMNERRIPENCGIPGLTYSVA